MKNQVEKLTVRIYDSKIIERMDDIWDEVKNLYRVKNKFLVDLLIRGIESVENESKSIDEMRADGNIFKELKRLTALLNRFVDIGYEHYKESFVIGKENQTLISRLYHIIFRMAEDNGISVQKYNEGLFDSLPSGFREITQNFIKEFEARENT